MRPRLTFLRFILSAVAAQVWGTGALAQTSAPQRPLPEKKLSEASSQGSGQRPKEESPEPQESPSGPRFIRLDPYRDIQRPINLKVGHPFRLVVEAQDPDGQPLTYSVRALPPGARFDPQTQVFSWVPEQTALGPHSPIFVAQNGKREATALVQLSVNENRAPHLEFKQLRFIVGQLSSHHVQGDDPDGDPITYSVQNLPKGAHFDEVTGKLTWTPEAKDAGRRTMTVSASDGDLSTSTTYQVITEDPEAEHDRRHGSHWNSFLQPGLGYAVYQPRNRDQNALFHGIDLQLSLISWIHKTDQRGPSHGRFYVSADILKNSKRNAPLFIYSLGLTLTLERNPERSWLLPHYGVEIGGLTQEEIGGKFQSRFFGGLHLWASPNLFVNAEAGYFLVPGEMKNLSGFSAKMNSVFSLW